MVMAATGSKSAAGATMKSAASESNRTIGVTFLTSLSGDVLVAASWRG